MLVRSWYNVVLYSLPDEQAVTGFVELKAIYLGTDRYPTDCRDPCHAFRANVPITSATTPMKMYSMY